jgi:manganese/iron transport system permease protein
VNTLLDPFEFEFFIRGMLAAGLVGALTGAVGIYVVLRRLAYIGHGLAHSIFGGAVVSFVTGINFYVGASVWGTASALLINLASRRRQISGDAAIGIITTSAFALGVALISRGGKFTRDFDAALFGEILGVTALDLYVILGTIVLVGLVIFFFWKQLLFMTFDESVAETYGVPTMLVEVLFALVLAATIIASLQVLGVTLIAAALVIPPVIARLLTDSFNRMFVYAIVVGGLSGFLGVYLSWFVNVSSGASVVLFQAAVFAVVLAVVSLRSYFSLGVGLSDRLAGVEGAGID